MHKLFWHMQILSFFHSPGWRCWLAPQPRRTLHWCQEWDNGWRRYYYTWRSYSSLWLRRYAVSQDEFASTNKICCYSADYTLWLTMYRHYKTDITRQILQDNTYRFHCPIRCQFVTFVIQNCIQFYHVLIHMLPHGCWINHIHTNEVLKKQLVTVCVYLLHAHTYHHT